MSLKLKGPPLRTDEPAREFLRPTAANEVVEYQFPALHPAQELVRNSNAKYRVLCAGRRFGKTVLASLLALESGLSGGQVYWVGPDYARCEEGWRALLGYAKSIPGAEPELSVRRVWLPGGGFVHIRSSDDPDSLRGAGLDRVIMEEAAFQKEYTWTEVLSWMLMDRDGDAIFISTPNGRNWFAKRWMLGQDRKANPEWESWRYSSDDNPTLSQRAILSVLNENKSDRARRQEFHAEFVDDGEGVFRGVEEAIDRSRGEEWMRQHSRPELGKAYVLGIDLGRKVDWTVLTILEAGEKGRQVYFERFRRDWELQYSRILQVMTEWQPSLTLIDSTGIGDAAFDYVNRRRPVNCRMIPFIFSATSKEQIIENLVISLERRRLELMNLPMQEEELISFRYETTAAGNTRMNSPADGHDDTVSALALANWGLWRKEQYRPVEIFTV